MKTCDTEFEQKMMVARGFEGFESKYEELDEGKIAPFYSMEKNEREERDRERKIRESKMQEVEAEETVMEESESNF